MADTSILIPLEYHSFVHDFNGFDLHIFTFFWQLQLLVSETARVQVASVLFNAYWERGAGLLNADTIHAFCYFICFLVFLLID